MAVRVRKAVEQRKPLDLETPAPREQGGTIHLSAVDRHGGMVALTLTHGDGFGARVVVPGLGLLLGHGVSRFDPRPGHPNSPGPRKRPLHNMCPTIVTRDGRPVLAVGARGGRRIPNAVLTVLLEFVGQDRSMPEAIDAPRMHTEGDRVFGLDDRWPPSGALPFESMGYDVRSQSVAIASAVAADPSGISWFAHSR
jgi:gamma-glutamyltranspeptidase/glutathione hydrolase